MDKQMHRGMCLIYEEWYNCMAWVKACMVYAIVVKKKQNKFTINFS